MTIRDIGKLVAAIVGVLVVVLSIVVIVVDMRLPKPVPSNIVAFHPTPFDAKTTERFFYSIGDELRYSNRIDGDAKVLFRGEIKDFLVSPDSTKIAAVANGELVIVDASKAAVQTVTKVDSIYKEPKPVGKSFFRDQDFQWSRDSQTLYVIKDEYYPSKGSQLFSEKGELWKYDVSTGSIQPLLRPFRAFSYFLGIQSGVYFSDPDGSGNLQLKYFDGHAVINIGAADGSKKIPDNDLPSQMSGSPFFSFDAFDYYLRVLPAKGVSILKKQAAALEDLDVGGRSYLQISEGQDFKGPTYCADFRGSAFLPGDGYLLFNFLCGNYDGQLLIDVSTGDYMTLPKDSRVYVTANTESYTHYKVTSGGIEATK